MDEIVEHGYARVGLLGNPSDGYGGRCLAFTFEDFRAAVTLRDLDAGDDESFVVRSGAGAELLRAAARRFAVARPGALAGASVELSFATKIPRQVGLAGSSAIIIAALRALARRGSVSIAPDELAAIALAAETEEVGNAAGPMDRVIQSHEGFMDMDFQEPRAAARDRRLDPALLPPLFVAWNPRGGERSGIVHDEVRRRFERGEPAVRSAMAEFPRIAAEGVDALESGDLARFRALVDRNFDLRATIWTLAPADRELVAIGRAAGAAVKFAGSGGAVVGVLASSDRFDAVRTAYAARGYPTLRPRVGPARSSR